MKRTLLLCALVLSLGVSLRAGEYSGVSTPETGSSIVVPVVPAAPAFGGNAAAAAFGSSSLAPRSFGAQGTFRAEARIKAMRESLMAGDGAFDNGMAARDASNNSLGDKLRDAWNRIRGKKGPTPSGRDGDSANVGEPGERVYVTVKASSREQRTRAAELGVDIAEIYADRISGIAHVSSVERLNKAGLKVLKTESLDRIAAETFPADDSIYHDYAELTTELRALAAGNPKVSVFSIGKSLRGRDIWCVRINSTEKGQDASKKPGVVFMGNHHAREHLSVEVPLLLAKNLANSADAETQKLLEARDVYIIPMVNPDGAEYDVYNDEIAGQPNPKKSGYRMWRKNMAKNADGSYGVDLNRNYGYGWNTGGSSDDGRDETYHGPAAFSEPETRAIRDFVVARPNLKVLLSYHTFSELILYPWGGKSEPITDPRDRSTYETMAKTMAGWNGYTPEQSSELYIASGDTTDWAWGEKKIFSFTFELTPKSMWNGGFYPGAGVVNSTFQANLKPALYLIGLADNPYKVLDNGNGSSK